MHTIKALLGKVWKDEVADLAPGFHHFDEEFVVRVCGVVEKAEDQLVTPTVSVPLVTTLALFWEKCRLERDEALQLLREAIAEAMELGENEDRRIKQQMDDVNKAINAVRKDLLAKLPKMNRSGRTVLKDLKGSVQPVKQPVEVAA